MSERRDPAVYTIPPHRAFADALVSGILAQHGQDQMADGLRMLVGVSNSRKFDGHHDKHDQAQDESEGTQQNGRVDPEDRKEMEKGQALSFKLHLTLLC